MGKKVIVHVIDSLNTGGAEILLKNTVNLLKEFKHIIVYLYPGHELVKEFEGEVIFICLEHKGWLQMHSTVWGLQKVIKTNKPILVHSHLFVSTLCARLALPKNIPLCSTIHSTYSIDAFNKNRLSVWAEKVTLNRRHVLIGVSKYVLDDYMKYVSFKGKSFVLYNFMPELSFQFKGKRPPIKELHCIALGTLKEAKNYHYLLDLIAQLKVFSVTLDIYGDGPMRESLQERIDKEGLPVRLCGKVKEVHLLFERYNLLIQASVHEGFGISVTEAMAAGLPILLSDIPVFREITKEKAHFFPLHDVHKAASILLELKENAEQRNKFILEAFQFARQAYTQETYINRLFQIYNEVTSRNNK